MLMTNISCTITDVYIDRDTDTTNTIIDLKETMNSFINTDENRANEMVALELFFFGQLYRERITTDCRLLYIVYT